jgi:drug/metabolite transporter (DMT)-like permease
MYHYVVGITLFDMMKPYFRKHILTNIDHHEYILLNTFVVLLIIFSYFVYEFIFDNKFFIKTLENYSTLSYSQLGALFSVALLTVGSTTFLLKLDKHYNTPSVNSIILKSVSLVLLFVIGVVVFQEKYTMKKVIGIIVTIAGIILITT